MKVKVKNMTSSKGNKVANQFIIHCDDGTYFQSYQTIIAVRRLDGTVELDIASWDYSSTTGKYRNQFLNEGIADTRRKIDSGKYTLADLN